MDKMGFEDECWEHKQDIVETTRLTFYFKGDSSLCE
jgi:hypothetical protein